MNCFPRTTVASSISSPVRFDFSRGEERLALINLAEEVPFNQSFAMKALLFALVSFPGILLADDGLPNQPYLYVEGQGEIERPADLVTLRFDLVARDADQARANQEVQAKASKILAMLEQRKVSQSDIVASDLKSEPQFQEEPNRPGGRGKVTGYVVTRPFAAKLRDLTGFGKLVDDLIALGGIEFSGIEPGLAKEKQLQDEALAQALACARTQAEKTLKPLGMKISSVFALSPVTFPEIIKNMFGTNGVLAYRAAAPASGQTSSGYRLAPIIVSQRIHVIYLIVPVQ